jgi:uncharacterized protein (TIGR02118 family)
MGNETGDSVSIWHLLWSAETFRRFHCLERLLIWLWIPSQRKPSEGFADELRLHGIDFPAPFAYITPLPITPQQSPKGNSMVKLIALYKKPDDIESFDKHYAEVYAPLVKKLPGLRKTEVAKITGSAIGETPNYLICEMYFDSKDALDAALASASGRAAGKDLMSFAANYVTLMYANVTSVEEIKSLGD